MTKRKSNAEIAAETAAIAETINSMTSIDKRDIAANVRKPFVNDLAHMAALEGVPNTSESIRAFARLKRETLPALFYANEAERAKDQEGTTSPAPKKPLDPRSRIEQWNEREWNKFQRKYGN